MSIFCLKFRWSTQGRSTGSLRHQRFGCHEGHERSAVLQPSWRSGQALVEFAIISFCFTLLFSGILMLGFLIFGANVLQQAADVGAMEFARFPAPPEADFYTALEESGLYDESLLIMDEESYMAYRQSPGSLPLINHMLLPLFIYDSESQEYRYPGALATHDSIRTILIPLVGARDPETGVETIVEWRRIVEEVTPEDPPGSGTYAREGPYSLESSTPGSLGTGFVALRINYPYQSAAMVAYQYQTPEGGMVSPADAIGQDNIINVPIQANDQAVVNSASFPDGYVLTEENQYGFGQVYAHGMAVRPYRKVISAQGMYRREIFTASSAD